MLHQQFQCSINLEPNEPNKATTLSNLSTDCLGHVIEKLPLTNRFQDARSVNTQWAEVLENLCATQKKLTLQIGKGNEWGKMANNIKYNKPLINAVNPFHSLTATHLTNELTTFLISTFPRLQTLTVLVDDQTEDVTFLYYLPRLISAYADTLTTLQLIWKVKDATFQAIFSILIASVDKLHQLKQFSFCDLGHCLIVPPFDLPHLLRTSLNRLDFFSLSSPADLARHWVDSLQARSSKADVMNITYQSCYLPRDTLFPYALPANVAVHFRSAYLNMRTTAELEHFARDGAFANLQNLLLLLMTDTAVLSVGEVLCKLAASLPQLTDLTLLKGCLSRIDYPANRPLPVMPALRSLHLVPYSKRRPFHTLVKGDELRLAEVFPNVRHVELYPDTDRCVSCGWQMKPSDNGTEMVTGTEQMVEQCLTQMVTPFVTAGKAMPHMGVSFCKQSHFAVAYTVNFDQDGQVIKVTKYSQPI